MDTRLTELLQTIASQAYWDEEACVRELLSLATLHPNTRQRVRDKAEALIVASRQHKHERDTLDAFLEEFGLDSNEGVALMCLAEALLRIPDASTAEKLIHEKLLQGDWRKHVGHSDSLFVNASTWGMLLTGKWFQFEDSIKRQQHEWLNKLLDGMDEALVRRAVLHAMRVMSEQYILGETIEEALTRSKKIYSNTTRFSFDALGEGARTQADADRHYAAYADIIHKLASQATPSSIFEAHSISIKLSALHPRYQFSQHQRVMNELLPRVKSLCLAAKQTGIALSIDAEEAERLDLELQLFSHLALDKELINWEGLGFVLQAYQKRAVTVAEWLIELARQRKAKLCVRLVKGAYWDREIKRTQQLGLNDYPVFTHKANTDLNYLVCAQKLLSSGKEYVFPQFATHNAMTIALISEVAKDQAYELQRLHGMGQLLYQQLATEAFEDDDAAQPPVRVYAPIGGHRDLLPYLVRRLLENGANSSFINRFLDEKVPAQQLTDDIIDQVVNKRRNRHTKIPLPSRLFRDRENSSGLDIENPQQAETVLRAVEQLKQTNREQVIKPFINAEFCSDATSEIHINRNPSNLDEIASRYREPNQEEIDRAFASAATFQPQWNSLGGSTRAQILEQVGNALQEHRLELMALISFEAGRTLIDAEADIREAIDFCYYYAQQAKQLFADPQQLPGPTGEDNRLLLQGRGVFLCISPWNFPAAIFCGQITAALAAGNTVVAKPAEQTSAVATKIVQLMFSAGLPPQCVQLLAGRGSKFGPQLIQNHNLAGVCFTGSTQTAREINQQLAQREGPILPLIAETGGVNTLWVDSTALLEQVVDDLIVSAFNSAGQRCSAVRVLCVQSDIADELLSMLSGACDELCLGNPSELATDIGPVIDNEAYKKLTNYIESAKQEFTLLYQYPNEKLPQQGYFIGPVVFEIDHFAQVKGEVFGPVLHVLRFKATELDDVLRQVNESQYGLTLGVHSRLESWGEKIVAATRVGNNYINRNTVGAVVGVQPFGGQGLSGTGPKAGGPHYLPRFATEKVLTVNTVATGGNAPLFNLPDD